MATDDEEEDEDLPPLETPTEVAEEEEEEEEDEAQVPTQSRKHKETIDYNENLSKRRQSHVTVDDILFQLHLRGIQLTEEQEEEMDKFKLKVKVKHQPKRIIYYIMLKD